MHRFKAIPSLLRRGVVFLGLLVIISGLNGQRIIAGDILFRDGFAIYSTVGKVVIFSAIVLCLLIVRKKTAVSLRPWRPELWGWLGISLLACFMAWAAIGKLISGQREAIFLIAGHVGLVASAVAAGLGCFGVANLATLWREYRREIVYAVVIGGIFFGFLQVIYSLWQPLAAVVLMAVNGLLDMIGLEATLMPPSTLIFDKFSITIAQYCSGIESIALFTGFYVLVGLLDWRRFNKWRYFVLFPIALVVLCICNILRVFGLIVAGYHVNANLAFGLFHTYAGTVFFILYSALFWLCAYNFMCRPAPLQEQQA